MSGPPEQEGGGRRGWFAPLPPAKLSVNVLIFLKSPLNVSFLKELIKNVHENQYSTRVN